jgi:hypothetical protein
MSITFLYHIFFSKVSDIGLFVSRFFVELFKIPFEWNEVLKQSYLIGYKSLPLVGVTGFIMGLVLTIQSRPSLDKTIVNVNKAPKDSNRIRMLFKKVFCIEVTLKNRFLFINKSYKI